MAEDVDFAELVGRLGGYSGADVKAIAAKAATIPFMDAVGGAEPRPIAMKDILSVIDDMAPSVRKQNLIKYEEFAAGSPHCPFRKRVWDPIVSCPG